MFNKSIIQFFAIILALFYFVSTPLKVYSFTKSELENKLSEVDERLSKLGAESKETKDYLNALDEKLAYLKAQYEISKSDIADNEAQINSLETQINSKKRQIAKAKADISEMQAQLKSLNSSFEETYEAYCKRLRAIYISGDFGGLISVLLSSNGIADFLARAEMIRIVCENDYALLTKFKNESAVIVQNENKLKNEKAELESYNVSLKENKADLVLYEKELNNKNQELKIKKNNIEQQQSEANRLLLELNRKTNQYGEFRDITKEELDEIDRAIETANERYEQDNPVTEKPTENSNPTSKQKYIDLTYPCPAYKTISCEFGEYEGHTGCDFSTENHENQSIVAAESGRVIVSADLTTPKGEYRSYGRYIVIRHDKKAKNGQVVYTLYAHNNKRLVTEGEYVSKGQEIAKSGSTGNSTGPHCHFEVRIGGINQSSAVNPANYLK